MQHVYATMLLITGIASVLATIPQAIALYKVKQAASFSPLSWLLWLVYQLVALGYTITIKAYIYAVINFLWVCFYTAMVSMIIYYRKRDARITRG